MYPRKDTVQYKLQTYKYMSVLRLLVILSQNTRNLKPKQKILLLEKIKRLVRQTYYPSLIAQLPLCC